MVFLMVSGYFVHQSPQKKEKERKSEGERGKSAAGHLIVIVSLRSCGSAGVLLLFFFLLPLSADLPAFSVISNITVKNVIAIRS